MEKTPNPSSAIFAGGCFWCLESEFRSQEGVLTTESGYIGGHADNPSYENVTTGRTGHAEAVRVIYDPAVTSFAKLTEFFLRHAHDPTQVNRQGVDVGTQYRSEIFYLDDDQKRAAAEIAARLNAAQIFPQPIATRITAAGTFWPAEDYHQRYYEKHEARTGQPHIRMMLKVERKKSGKTTA